MRERGGIMTDSFLRDSFMRDSFIGRCIYLRHARAPFDSITFDCSLNVLQFSHIVAVH